MAIVYQANTTASDNTEVSTLSPTTGTNVISPISGADARILGNRISRRSTPTPESNGITNETYSTANYSVTWPMWLVALESGTGAFFRNWARHQSAGNSYAVQWFDGTLSLRSYTSGTPTTLGTYAWSNPTTGVEHQLVLDLNGSDLTVKLNGTTVIGPVTDSTYSAAGQVGYSIFGSENPATTGWRIGAFTVDTLTGGASTPASAHYRNGGLVVGTTTVSRYVFLQNTDGTPATGLTNATSGLVASYIRQGADDTTITLASGTATDAWGSGKFAEVSSTNAPGLYRLDVPNAAFSFGAAESVDLIIKGTGLRTYKMTIPLQLDQALWGGEAITGATTTSIPTAGLPTMTTGQLNRRLLQFVSGPCLGERVLIVGQSAANVIQVAPPLSTTPSDGDEFVIL